MKNKKNKKREFLSTTTAPNELGLSVDWKDGFSPCPNAREGARFDESVNEFGLMKAHKNREAQRLKRIAELIGSVS